jgi:hypothetical protein
MLRTVPNTAGVGLVRGSVRYRAREWITHRRRTTRFRLFSAVPAALMSGTRVSDCSRATVHPHERGHTEPK